MVRVCQALDEAAKEAGVDFLGGFSALVEKGFANGDRALIEALPEALATTDRICSSINVASSRSGINMDAVALMGEQILKVAQATADRGGLGCAKLVVFANIPQDVPFMAGAYLGVGEPMWSSTWASPAPAWSRRPSTAPWSTAATAAGP